MKKMHKMKLYSLPFQKIKNGSKDIELRLYDEKRRVIKVDDEIVFLDFENEKQTITAKVVAVHIFPTAKELYDNFSDKTRLGYDIGDVVDPNDIAEFYSKEREEKYGVVGIEIKLI